MKETHAVYRHIAFPLTTFDYLKDFQRNYAGKHGVVLNNNQALALILSQHKTFSQEVSA